ncbi:MAG: glycoside hydrolase family 16 protein [Pricia sp.]
MRIFILMFLLISCSSPDVEIIRVPAPESETPDVDPGTEPETERETEPEPEAEWNMVFEENFDDQSLTEWNVWESGAYNNEIQLYRREQLTVEDGILTITAKREAVTGDTNPFDVTPKDFEYVSGRLETTTQFGPSADEGENAYRIMARIKLPSGNGIWPAFWTLGDDWPTNGEIDILEARGNEPMTFATNIFYGTEVGVPLTQNDENTITEYELAVDITADFHEYELIWRADSLEIFFDGQLLKRYDANGDNYIAELFNKKHNVILNTAVGGLFFPPDADSAEFADEASMQVDWVRIFKR